MKIKILKETCIRRDLRICGLLSSHWKRDLVTPCHIMGISRQIFLFEIDSPNYPIKRLFHMSFFEGYKPVKNCSLGDEAKTRNETETNRCNYCNRLGTDIHEFIFV